MEQVSKIPTVVFWAGMLSFFFFRDSTFRRKTSRGRGNAGLYMVIQKTAIHTFSSFYRRWQLQRNASELKAEH